MIIFLISERDEEIQKELEKLKQENEELRKFVNEHKGRLAVLTFYILMDFSFSFNTINWESVIFLPAHPASFSHKFCSGMQSFYFSKSPDAIVLQTCHES